MDKDIYTVRVERPLGSTHPEYPDTVYTVNYGYIEGIEKRNGQKQYAYIIGVDIPLEQFTGKKTAVVHRHSISGSTVCGTPCSAACGTSSDASDTIWIIAPDNIPFTIQQIEAFVHFQEQYYDSHIEILNDEMWDAYDELGNKLNRLIPRSKLKSLPDGVFHIVVSVYTVLRDGRILVTQRSKNKTNAFKWEVTGGSILAGETPVEGALRELCEETGISQQADELNLMFRWVNPSHNTIYYAYATKVKYPAEIRLQYGETMNCEKLSLREFKQLIISDEFVPSEKARYIRHKDIVDKTLRELIL